LRREGLSAKYKDAERIWKAVSVDALPNVFYQQLGTMPEVWPWLTEAIWARWLDVWSKQDGRFHQDVTVFSVLPDALALQAVRDGRVDPWCHEVRDVLWKRMPAALLDLVDELAMCPPNPHPKVPDSGGPISWLVYAAPAEQCPWLVERAHTWLSAPSAYPGVVGWVRRWLARVVEHRSPGWREAYALIFQAPEDISQ
jgi:hypothetical protein